MIKTKHFMKRTSQRGITQNMILYVLNNGEIIGDKYIVNRKILLDQINHLQEQLAIAKKLLDKGGVVVVSEYPLLITAYDFDSRRKAYVV